MPLCAFISEPYEILQLIYSVTILACQNRNFCARDILHSQDQLGLKRAFHCISHVLAQ